jgi:hypothetical protein
MTYKTLTIELASDDLVRLQEGVTKFGHITMMMHSLEGHPVYLTVNGARKQERPRRTTQLPRYDPGKAGSGA